MSDYENHWVTQGVPEIEDAQPESIIDRKAREHAEYERLLNSDLLDMYLNMGFTGLSDRLIQQAVQRSYDRSPDDVQEAFDKFCLKDCHLFCVRLDIWLRRFLDESQKDFSAFSISNSIEVVLRDRIKELVEGME